MARKEVEISEVVAESLRRIASPGALLVAGVDKPNIMAIGWGTIGIVWSRPVFTALVRHSRYTHEFMEEHDAFTVCIPSPGMKDDVMFCGTRSGRDTDKIAECGFIMREGIKVKAPYIEQCPVHYECRIVHRNEVVPENLSETIKREYYSGGDYHTVYFGEIQGVFRENRS